MFKDRATIINELLINIDKSKQKISEMQDSVVDANNPSKSAEMLAKEVLILTKLVDAYSKLHNSDMVEIKTQAVVKNLLSNPELLKQLYDDTGN